MNKIQTGFRFRDFNFLDVVIINNCVLKKKKKLSFINIYIEINLYWWNIRILTK